MPERPDKPRRTYGPEPAPEPTPAPSRANKPYLDPLLLYRDLKTLTVQCKPCNERWTFMMSDLLKFFGPEYKMVYLRYDMILCPKRLGLHDCMVRYVNEKGVDPRVEPVNVERVNAEVGQGAPEKPD